MLSAIALIVSLIALGFAASASIAVNATHTHAGGFTELKRHALQAYINRQIATALREQAKRRPRK